MPAPIRTPRDRWISAGLRALGRGGVGSVRIESLAKDLGVTKGGFYGLFGDRTELLEALLDEWERRSIDDVLARVEEEHGSAPDRIRRAGLLTFAEDLLPIDLAVRSWARTDVAVARRLRRVDNRRMAYLREQLGTFVADPDEIEARATLAFCLLVGNHFLAADHGGRTRHDVVERAGALLLEPS